ncbi:MAG: sugar transferase, partial [Candidatus Omnitrophota bacterium]
KEIHAWWEDLGGRASDMEAYFDRLQESKDPATPAQLNRFVEAVIECYHWSMSAALFFDKKDSGRRPGEGVSRLDQEISKVLTFPNMISAYTFSILSRTQLPQVRSFLMELVHDPISRNEPVLRRYLVYALTERFNDEDLIPFLEETVRKEPEDPIRGYALLALLKHKEDLGVKTFLYEFWKKNFFPAMKSYDKNTLLFFSYLLSGLPLDEIPAQLKRAVGFFAKESIEEIIGSGLAGDEYQAALFQARMRSFRDYLAGRKGEKAPFRYEAGRFLLRAPKNREEFILLNELTGICDLSVPKEWIPWSDRNLLLFDTRTQKVAGAVTVMKEDRSTEGGGPHYEVSGIGLSQSLEGGLRADALETMIAGTLRLFGNEPEQYPLTLRLSAQRYFKMTNAVYFAGLPITDFKESPSGRPEMRGANLEEVLQMKQAEYPGASLRGPESAPALVATLNEGAGLSLLVWPERNTEAFSPEETRIFESDRARLTAIKDFHLTRGQIKSLKLSMYDRSSGGIRVRGVMEARGGQKYYLEFLGTDTSSMERLRQLMPPLETLKTPGAFFQVSAGNLGFFPGNFGLLTDRSGGWIYSGASDEPWAGKPHKVLVEFKDGKRRLGILRLEGDPARNHIRRVSFQPLGGAAPEQLLNPREVRFILRANKLVWGHETTSQLLREDYNRLSDLRHIFRFPSFEGKILFYDQLVSEETDLSNAFDGKPLDFLLKDPEGTAFDPAGVARTLQEMFGYILKPSKEKVTQPGDFFISGNGIRLIFLPARYPLNGLAIREEGNKAAFIAVQGTSGRKGANYWEVSGWLEKKLGWTPDAFFILDNGMDPSWVDLSGKEPITLLKGRDVFSAALIVKAPIQRGRGTTGTGTKRAEMRVHQLFLGNSYLEVLWERFKAELNASKLFASEWKWFLQDAKRFERALKEKRREASKLIVTKDDEKVLARNLKATTDIKTFRTLMSIASCLPIDQDGLTKALLQKRRHLVWKVAWDLLKKGAALDSVEQHPFTILLLRMVLISALLGSEAFVIAAFFLSGGIFKIVLLGSIVLFSSLLIYLSKSLAGESLKRIRTWRKVIDHYLLKIETRKQVQTGRRHLKNRIPPAGGDQARPEDALPPAKEASKPKPVLRGDKNAWKDLLLGNPIAYTGWFFNNQRASIAIQIESYDSKIAAHVYPFEDIDNVQLGSSENYLGAKKGSLGRILFTFSKVDGEWAVVVQEIQTTHEFNLLPEAVKDRYMAAWVKRTIDLIAAEAAKIGIEKVYAMTPEEVKRVFSYRKLTHEGVLYKSPFKKWKKSQSHRVHEWSYHVHDKDDVLELRERQGSASADEFKERFPRSFEFVDIEVPPQTEQPTAGKVQFTVRFDRPVNKERMIAQVHYGDSSKDERWQNLPAKLISQNGMDHRFEADLAPDVEEYTLRFSLDGERTWGWLGHNLLVEKPWRFGPWELQPAGSFKETLQRHQDEILNTVRQAYQDRKDGKRLPERIAVQRVDQNSTFRLFLDVDFDSKGNKADFGIYIPEDDMARLLGNQLREKTKRELFLGRGSAMIGGKKIVGDPERVRALLKRINDPLKEITTALSQGISGFDEQNWFRAKRQLFVWALAGAEAFGQRLSEGDVDRFLRDVEEQTASLAEKIARQRSEMRGAQEKKILPRGDHAIAEAQRWIGRGLALILGIITLPLVIALGLLIKSESPGPMFFKQIRAGYKGKDFTVWKLRTMTHEEDPALRRAHRIGLLLRSTGLDELPQLWQIAIGQMQWFAPRPRIKKELRPGYVKNILEHARPGFFSSATLLNGIGTGNAKIGKRLMRLMRKDLRSSFLDKVRLLFRLAIMAGRNLLMRLLKLEVGNLKVLQAKEHIDIKAAALDWDGTISRLREGWEGIMAPMMAAIVSGIQLTEGEWEDVLKSVMGNDPYDRDSMNPAMERLVVERGGRISSQAMRWAVETVEETKGMATLLQFKKAYEKAVQEGHGDKVSNWILEYFRAKGEQVENTPPELWLTHFFQERLEQVIQHRYRLLKNGKISAKDLLIPGGVEFIRKLKERGIEVSIITGSNTDTVKKEIE